MANRRKRRRISMKPDFFDGLPDDLVLSILGKLSSSTKSPSDLITILITCKRMNRLGLNPQVLSMASQRAFAIRAKNWSDSAHRFLKKCVFAGNVEATYTLGMIRFYCLQNRGSGASLMAKAAMKNHGPALHSLAVIQFNGSGGLKSSRDLQAGVALCARAASLGHIDSLRELGHCLQDGYGIPKDFNEGRRLIAQANALDVAFLLRAASRWPDELTSYCAPILSDFGGSFPARKVHPANRFLSEWFRSGPGRLGPEFRLCGFGGCGRPETRASEFRRCAVCGTENYCSRGCQALDWKYRHKEQCRPHLMWLANAGIVVAAGAGINGGNGGVQMEEGEGENVHDVANG
ncbi:hypothetical protein UlMin_007703 [Ulmus minor]